MVIFAFVLAYYLLRTIIVQFFGSLLLSMFGCYREQKKSIEIGEDLAPGTHFQRQTDIYKEYSISCLSDFYKRSTYELNSFKQMVSSKKYDKTKLDTVAIETFKHRLTERITNIEATIDFYLACLIRASKKDSN